MPTDPDAPATPTPIVVIASDSPFKVVAGTGLTKREAFAMAAMQGIIAGRALFGPANVSKDAVAQADALIAALNVKRP